MVIIVTFGHPKFEMVQESGATMVRLLSGQRIYQMKPGTKSILLLSLCYPRGFASRNRPKN